MGSTLYVYPGRDSALHIIIATTNFEKSTGNVLAHQR